MKLIDKQGLRVGLWLVVLGLLLCGLWQVQRGLGARFPLLAPAVGAGAVGTFHAHSTDSHDGRLSPEDMITLAEQAGLDFLVFTEHNVQRQHKSTGTLQVLSAAELSTPQGHTIQLGLPSLLPEPIRRSKQVHRQIRQAGGKSIVAHPSCPKRPWLGDLDQIGGIEIANTATALRTMGGMYWLGLWPMLLFWPLHPTLALSQLYQRDGAALALWDSVEDSGVAGFCGTDTHGWLDASLTLQHWLLQLSHRTQGGVALDAESIGRALMAGQFHCIAGLLAPKVQFAWAARWANVVVGGPGDTLSAHQVDTLEAAIEADVPISIRLYRDGVEVLRTDSSLLRYAHPAPGIYRVEVWLTLQQLFWGSYEAPMLYSNRIRLLGESKGE